MKVKAKTGLEAWLPADKRLELWRAGKLIGTMRYVPPFFSHVGLHIQFPIMVKGGKIITVIVPIFHRVIFDDGVDMTHRLCGDVTKKSKKQIALLKEY